MPQNVQYQYQYQDEEDIYKCIKNCKPPPPPGKEDLWELQFCRWWGWNWVRKRQLEDKKAPKKAIKNFLRFKKGQKRNCELQNLYNTPSNSVVVEAYTCGVTEVKTDSMQKLEVERNISRKCTREVGEDEKCQNIISWIKQKKSSSSSSELCCCCSCPGRDRIEERTEERTEKRTEESTEESIEYINITCCPCCHSKTEPPSKNLNNCETQTSKRAVVANDTQTSQISAHVCAAQTTKKHKKRRICLICCHCLKNYSCNCKCPPLEKVAKASEKVCAKLNKIESKNTNFIIPQDDSAVTKNSLRNALGHKYTPLYIGDPKYPIDTMLYHTKHFSNIGRSFPNYSRLHNTNSDILDSLHKLKIEDEFSSPVSGKIYNLTPAKLDNIKVKTPTLPDFIDVNEDIKHLKNLENKVKVDLESRIMLDAVCDAILSNKSSKASSCLLNEITHPLKRTRTSSIRQEIYGTENDLYSIKKSLFEELEPLSILKNSNISRSNYYGNQEITSSFDVNKLQLNLDFDLSNNLSNKREKIKKINIARDDATRPFTFDYNNATQQEILEENGEHKWFETNDDPLFDIQNVNPSLTKTDLTSFDNYFSSTLSKDGRSRELKDLLATDISMTNITAVFNKIDEIIWKSKVNNDKIENVLNTIPKSMCHCSSSEDITSDSNPDDTPLKHHLAESMEITEQIRIFPKTESKPVNAVQSMMESMSETEISALNKSFRISSEKSVKHRNEKN